MSAVTVVNGLTALTILLAELIRVAQQLKGQWALEPEVSAESMEAAFTRLDEAIAEARAAAEKGQP